MYRARGSSKNSGAGAPKSDSRSPENSSLNPSTAASIVTLKVRLLSPFMKYDKTLKQVVVNPEHDRNFRSEVARVQGVVLRELRRTLEFESRHTPKEALYMVQKSVMLAFASCAVSSDTGSLVPCRSDEEAETFMPALEKIFAERNACPKAVVSLAAVVSTGVVRDSFGMICQRLESRLASEEASPANLRRTDSELQALSATKKNAQDFFQFRAALLTAFDSISVPSSGGSDGPVPRESGSADGTSAYLLVKSFYSLLGWMLMVQPDRLSLTTSRTTPAPSSRAQNSAEPPVHVTYYDPPSGKITIERASAAFRWGLMINMEGRLIGLENALRTATPTGGELYYALQLRDDGLPIYSINGVSLRDAEDTGKGAEETEEIQTKRLEKLQEILKGKQTKVTLIVGGVPGLHDPQVVAFELVHQGGEGALGQEACLILRRASLSVDWGIKLSKNEDGQLILDGVSSSLALSSDANEFINAHIGNLHVVQVNGFGSSSRNFHEDIMRTSLFLKLRLQSVAKVGPVATEAGVQDEKGKLSRPVTAEPGSDKTTSPASQGITGNTAPTSSRSAGALDSVKRMETQEQATLKGPEKSASKEEGALAEPKKRGRPRKATQTPTVTTSDAAERAEGGKTLSAEGKAMAGTSLGEESGEAARGMKSENVALGGDTELEKAKGSKEKRGRKKTKDLKDARKKKVGKKQKKAAKKAGRPQKNTKEKKSKGTKLKKEKREKAKEEGDAQGKEASKGEHTQERTTERAKISESTETVTLKEVAEAQGVLEKPLVEGRSHSEAAEAVVKQKQDRKQPTPSDAKAAQIESKDTPSKAPGDGEAVKLSPELVAELKGAPPLTFDNSVTVDRFDGTNLELRRPDLNTSWDIRMSHGGEHVFLTRLPPLSTTLKAHPFMKTLQPDETGKISWQVEEVNGIDLKNASKPIRSQAMDSIKKSAKVSFILRRLAK